MMHSQPHIRFSMEVSVYWKMTGTKCEHEFYINYHISTLLRWHDLIVGSRTMKYYNWYLRNTRQWQLLMRSNHDCTWNVYSSGYHTRTREVTDTLNIKGWLLNILYFILQWHNGMPPTSSCIRVLYKNKWLNINEHFCTRKSVRTVDLWPNWPSIIHIKKVQKLTQQVQNLNWDCKSLNFSAMWHFCHTSQPAWWIR